MDSYQHVRQWVDDLPKKGRSSFSLDDVRAQFPDVSDASLRNSLYRLSASGRVSSVWRGFYAIVLPEYGLEGNVPPVEYINQLMTYIKVDYYIALLSAASFQGASHQAPQVFQVITNKQLRSKNVKGSRLEFTFKGNGEWRRVEQRMVKSGYVNVSVPFLTALDLVSYSSKSGGMSHVTSVLAELADSIELIPLDVELLASESRATIQRLGYLLEYGVHKVELAEALYKKCKEAGLRFRKTKLVTGQQDNKGSYNPRWKIVINYDMEVDE